MIDKICDHAGGLLIVKGENAICPMHNWKFDPIKGVYKNGFKKEKKNYLIKKDDLLIDISEKIPKISKEKTI